MTWAGDSVWRRMVAWLGQTALILTAGLVGIVIVMQVLVPNMIDGLTEVFRNSIR